MPNLSEYQAIQPIKMLFVGDSGKGKTGALASLAEAGFNVRILDFDRGVGILASILKSKPEALSKIIYETCTDQFQEIGGKIIPVGVPSAFTKGLRLLTHWKTKELDLGKITTWTRNEVLVLDSFTHMCNAAMVYVMALNNRSGDHPWQGDWGQAMDYMENVLKLLYSDAIKCHVIVNTHITFVGGTENDKGQVTGAKPYPNALGQKLPPKVGQYFNTMLQADSVGLGNNAKRIIRTTPNGELGIKSEILGLPKELPLESGLAMFFKAAGHTVSLTKEV